MTQSSHHLPPLADLIADIRLTHRLRRSNHNAEKRLTLQLKAMMRSEAAFRVRKAGGEVKRKFPPVTKADKDLVLSTFPEMVEALAVITSARKKHEKRLVQLAKLLPVYPWVESVKGFGALGLAIIAGEAGDLANYSNPAKLWRRMGMSVMDGKAEKNKKGKSVGYSPQRRSALYTIGDSLIKGNKGEYRAIYLERKAYEMARGEEFTKSKMHGHRKAQRYMEKRLLKDLWSVWRAG